MLYSGNAYAATANVSVLGLADIRANPLANLHVQCFGTNGKTKTKTAADTLIGALLGLDVAESTGKSTETASTASLVVTSEIAEISLLGGLITADAITLVASASATNNDKIETSDAGTSFLDLRVAGQPIQVSEGLTLPLAGLGEVRILDRKTSGNGKKKQTITLRGLVVRVLQGNSFGLPVGAEIEIGYAKAGLQRGDDVTADNVSANASGITTKGTAAIIGENIGPIPKVGLACGEADGVPNVAETAEISGAPVVVLSGLKVSVVGGKDGDESYVEANAKVESTRLLGGLVTAKAIQVGVSKRADDDGVTESDITAEFLQLKIAGIPVPVNVPVNTRIDIPLVGYAALNEVVTKNRGGEEKTTVTGLRIVVELPNLLGLPVGAQVIVARATAAIQLD